MTVVDAAATRPAQPSRPDQGAEVPLWPGGAPGSAGIGSPEIVEPASETVDHIRLRNVHNPSLTTFFAPPEAATSTAVIVAPGGGHKWLSMDIEGYNVAEYLNSIGVSAFPLKYRLAREDGSPYEVETHALQDARRAIRLVRSRAAAWGVDPARVVMMGFSAGAQLTVLAATRFDAGESEADDPVERQSSRPDYQALIYGGGRQLETLTFSAQTPPAFILGADDDRLVSEHLPRLYLALKGAGVPAELHIYVDGGHGFGIRKPPRPLPCTSTWQLRLRDWLGDRGLLAKH